MDLLKVTGFTGFKFKNMCFFTSSTNNW